MQYLIAFLLIIFWIFGLLIHAMGTLIHIFLILATMVILLKVIRSRRVI